MKRLLFFFCLFSTVKPDNSEHYLQAKERHSVIFDWVEYFINSGTIKRSIIVAAAEKNPKTVKESAQKMTCQDLHSLLSAKQKNGETVKELINRYPFFQNLFNDLENNCVSKTEINPVENTKQPDKKKKKIIPTKYPPLLSFFSQKNCKKKEHEQDQQIIKSLLLHANVERAHTFFQTVFIMTEQ